RPCADVCIRAARQVVKENVGSPVVVGHSRDEVWRIVNINNAGRLSVGQGKLGERIGAIDTIAASSLGRIDGDHAVGFADRIEDVQLVLPPIRYSCQIGS